MPGMIGWIGRVLRAGIGPRPTILAALLAVTLLAPAAMAQAPQPAERRPEVGYRIAADAEPAIRAARLGERLVSARQTDPQEDRALARALGAHRQRLQPDDFRNLTQFLSQHPRSGWAPALHADLGRSYLHYGYFSRAIEAWRQAWQLGRDATDPQARLAVDRAVADLARLYAAFGQTDNLRALLREIGSRPIAGSATEAFQAAREQLDLVEKDPRHLFICGPVALQIVTRAAGIESSRVDFLRWYRAGPDGTSLAEVAGLAERVGFAHRTILRRPGQAVPIPSVVHWKVGHFAAIVGRDNGRFRVVDPVFPGQALWVTPEALDEEASGYFLVGEDVAADAGWQTVASAEAERIRGKGPTSGTQFGFAGDRPTGCTPNSAPGAAGANGGGMCAAAIRESSVGIMIFDRPVGYQPPFGPSVDIYLTYNQREDSQPANFDYTNIGQKWTLNWVDFIVDDPGNPGASVLRNLSGGGSVAANSFNAATGRFAANPYDGSVLILASTSPIVYRRLKSDGGIDVYAESNGATAYPRRIFLSQVIDPQGNAVTLNYDAEGRLASIADAGGRQTVFSYDSPGRSLLVSRITDAYGRSASLGYDDLGRLVSITDTIGLVSSLAYDANWLVNALTTPYGTTSFAYTAPGTSGPPRFAEIADPMGFRERMEWIEPGPIATAEPAGTVPQGMPIVPINNYLDYRNSFHWDKSAYAVAGCTPSGGCNYSMARVLHFLHVWDARTKSTTLESVRQPYENRVWYGYPGQVNTIDTGVFAQPSAIGRVLDDGSTQLTRISYDTANFYKPTQIVDPLGRTTSIFYANGIDPTAIVQTGAAGWPQVLAQWTWDYRHRPASYTDAAGQTTLYKWNAAGQPLSVTNPLGQTTSWQYDGSGRLSTVTNANDAVVATFTYDAFDRVASFTDSEGWTVGYAYDAADRLVRTTYPDGTTETYSYDKLDLASFRDRLGRVWTYTYDANRRRIAVTDPAGLQTQFGYDNSGRLTALTDPKGNVTRWRYDVQGRPAAKIYPDGKGLTYVYEATTSRLRAVIDALGQRKEYSYARDDQVTGIAYVNAVNPTPGVTFAYDPYLPRLVSMTDGTGTTTYSYVPLGTPGALQLQQETLPLASASIAYSYDALGRVSGRTVAGSGAETFAYDAIGRLTGKTNDLGTFTLSYLGETGQIVQRALTGSTLATTWTYLNNTGDRRLAGIGNVGLTAGEYSNFAFTTLVDGSIASVTETSDAAPVYPTEARQVASVNDLNQLQVATAPVRTYDANGNLLSDGTRVYAWDAENRLVGITYPGQPGKQSAFTYDGQGRRITIGETPPGGGSTVTSSYVWCNDTPCQSRNAASAVERTLLEEGERVSGGSPQSLYYGRDQIGSVRRVFASGGAAPTYGYDPYGQPLQATPQLTEFGYARMRTHAESGLYTTWFRLYDPAAGRWLSRDPVGEASDGAGNLYAYVSADPIGRIDPNGDIAPVVAAAAMFAAAFMASSPANAPGQCDPRLPRDEAAPLKNAAMVGGMAGAGRLGAAAVNGMMRPKDKLGGVADDLENWLGPNYTTTVEASGNVRVQSADGTRQVRFDIKDFHGDPRGAHINVETYAPRNAFPGDRNMIRTSNQHIYFGGR